MTVSPAIVSDLCDKEYIPPRLVQLKLRLLIKCVQLQGENDLRRDVLRKKANTRGTNIPGAWCWVAAMSSSPASKFTPSLSQRSSCSSVSTTTAAVSEGLVQPVVGRGPAALTKAMTQSRGRRPLFLRNLLCVPSPWWYLKDGYEETVTGLLDNSRATAVVGDRAFTSPGVAIAAHLARTGFSRRPAQDCRG